MERICQDRDGAAEGLLPQKCVLKNLDRDGLWMPQLPDTLNADDGVSLRFIIERVGQWTCKSPGVFEVEKRRSGRQNRRSAVGMRNDAQVGLLVRGSNVSFDFAGALIQSRFTQTVLIVGEQISDARHPSPAGIASQNSQAAQGTGTGRQPGEDPVPLRIKS
jgi:hypothetical protein